MHQEEDDVQLNLRLGKNMHFQQLTNGIFFKCYCKWSFSSTGIRHSVEYSAHDFSQILKICPDKTHFVQQMKLKNYSARLDFALSFLARM